MAMSKAQLNEYRLHAVTILTGASAAMSQIDQMSQWSPLAAALAFFVASSSYVQAIGRIDNLVDELEDAGIIDEETADMIDEVVDAVESVVDSEGH